MNNRDWCQRSRDERRPAEAGRHRTIPVPGLAVLQLSRLLNLAVVEPERTLPVKRSFFIRCTFERELALTFAATTFFAPGFAFARSFELTFAERLDFSRPTRLYLHLACALFGQRTLTRSLLPTS